VSRGGWEGKRKRFRRRGKKREQEPITEEPTPKKRMGQHTGKEAKWKKRERGGNLLGGTSGGGRGIKHQMNRFAAGGTRKGEKRRKHLPGFFSKKKSNRGHGEDEQSRNCESLTR